MNSQKHKFIVVLVKSGFFPFFSFKIEITREKKPFFLFVDLKFNFFEEFLFEISISLKSVPIFATLYFLHSLWMAQ